MRKSFLSFCFALFFTFSLYASGTTPDTRSLASKTPPNAIGATFHREVEFPNYFLPSNFKELSEAQKKEILTERRSLLEDAVSSISKRLMVPVAKPGSPKGELTNVRYFDYVRDAIQDIDPNAQIMPSGGVVRSVLGYLYDEMHTFALVNPGKDPLSVLNKITKDTRDIDAIEVRGVGGDFDVLIKCAPDKFESLKTKVEEITNSAEDSLGARQDNTQSSKRMLFTIGDVKAYEEQTQRSTQQGGSTIDFLAFDQKKGKFVEPEGHNYIVDDFLKAQYRYIAPSSGQKPEAFQKQVVRGVRPLMELPFLDLIQEPSEQFEKELRQLIEELKTKGNLETKALEQVGKAIRNGRRSLGNNRIVRASTEVEKLIRELSDELQKRNLEKIPEYVDHSPIELRDPQKKSELNGFPKELLTPIEEFIAKKTTDGKLFHGTPSLDNAMAIMRGGLYYSGGRYKQGGFAEGGGGYSGSTKEAAKEFPDGLTLELKVKNDPRINAVIDSPAFQKWIQDNDIENKATKLGMDTHQYLQRYHGIDFIAKNAVLIQNTGALEFGKPKQRVATALAALKKGDIPSLLQYEKLQSYGKALGIDVKPIESKDWVEAIKTSGEKSARDELTLLASFGHKAFKDHPEALMEFIKVCEKTNALDALSNLAEYGHEALKAHPEAMAAFKDVFPRAIRAAGVRVDLDALTNLAIYGHEVFKDHPEALMEFIKACETTNAPDALANLAKFGHEALKAHPEALMEFIKACEKTNTLYALDNLAIHGHEVFKDHPEALMEFIKVSEKIGNLDALSNLAEYGHEALKAHPEAMAAFKDVFPRAIRAAGDRVDLNALAKLARYRHEVFENHPEAMAAFKDAFPRAIRAAGVRGDLDALSNLAFHGHEALKDHPEAMAAFKDAFPRTIRAAGDRGDFSALSNLAFHGHEALKAHPVALMEFIKACEKTNARYALYSLAKYGHEALKAHPEAMAAFKDAFPRTIRAAGDRGDFSALSNLAQYRHETLNAHPEALLALLETLARNPQPQKDGYREAVQNTNWLLEAEFNNNEKLSELFLSSKNGKEVLLLLAKNKNFPTINNWLARTKEALPAETLSLIQDTDAHQREARKSLSTSSDTSNSGNSVDKCLHFLRLVSLKYSN